MPSSAQSDALADLQSLAGALYEGALLWDTDTMAAYRWDRANAPDAGIPLAVVRVESTEEVQDVVRIASHHHVPVVVRGAGSGLSGGSTAVGGCIVVSTERMRAIRIDPSTRTASVEPGLMNAEGQAAAAEYGLWYPADPSSFELCSIGGTNLGGA